jgi:DNA-binding IclR family transcriptional regulator
LRLLSTRPSIRVAEAADALGIARSTAHRLLTTLKDNQFAAQDKPNAAYRIGSALTEIGLAAIRRLDVRSAARPILEELRAQTGETVSLSVLEGQYVRFVDCLEGTLAVRVGDRTGIVLPSSSTAGGKAILAALPTSDLLLRYPSHQLPVLTRASRMTLPALRAELDEVRRNGYAVNNEESESRISAVAVAVRDASGSPAGAIAIVVPADRYTPEAVDVWAALLLTAAQAVERSLGAHG